MLLPNINPASVQHFPTLTPWVQSRTILLLQLATQQPHAQHAPGAPPIPSGLASFPPAPPSSSASPSPSSSSKGGTSKPKSDLAPSLLIALPWPQRPWDKSETANLGFETLNTQQGPSHCQSRPSELLIPMSFRLSAYTMHIHIPDSYTHYFLFSKLASSISLVNTALCPR